MENSYILYVAASNKAKEEKKVENSMFYVHSVRNILCLARSIALRLPLILIEKRILRVFVSPNKFLLLIT